MKIILKIAGFELENLVYRKMNWILAAAYTASAFILCLFDGFRQSYFSDVESVPIILIHFIAPFFLAAILITALSPVFAGDKEQGINQIPAACLIGSKGRSIAKILAGSIFSVFCCTLTGIITAAATSACGLFDGTLKMNRAAAGLELPTEWTVSQYLIFSFVCLCIGCLILSLFILYISCASAALITAVSISGTVILFEFLFHRFSFPIVIKEYNIWMFLKPYSFFMMRFLHFPPLINLLLLSAAFLPVCAFAVQQISRKGM